MMRILSEINAIALRLLESLTQNEAYRTICEETMRLVGASYASIYLEKGDILEKVYASSPELYRMKALKSGFTYRALRMKTPFTVEASQFETIYPDTKGFGIKLAIFVPLSHRRKTVGVLVMQCKFKKHLTPQEIDALKLIGSMASLAITKTQLYEKSRKKSKTEGSIITIDSEFQKIYQAGLQLLLPETTEETYACIVEEGIKLVNADDGLVLLKIGEEFKNVYGSSKQASAVVPRPRGYGYTAYRRQRAFIVQQRRFKNVQPTVAESGVMEIMFLPLSYQDKSIGTLVIRSYKHTQTFNNDQLGIMELFASMASLAIKKSQLYDETKKALEVRDMFISMAAHELRTPLTTINGYIQLLQHKLQRTSNAEAKWVRELVYESKRLTHLVNELLEVNKMRSGKLHFNWRESDLREILERVVTNFKLTHPHQKLTFTRTVKTAPIIGDPEKLIQVLLNVLDNAAKFSPKEAPITVRLTETSSSYIVAITDRGKGISIEDLNKVFEIFYKGSSQASGMGLGLYIVQNIVTQHHGLINISSKLNKGTTIEIELPKIKS